jgi:hypothetical protein
MRGALPPLRNIWFPFTLIYRRFEVSTAMKTEVAVFWDVTQSTDMVR